jgi:aminoglycoside phosphotransferase (APT) family kinase protein
MNEPWKAEIVVSKALAISLLEEQFPALVPVSAEPFGAGWDNTAFLVNGTFVVRFPRRKIAVPLLAREESLLPLVAPNVSLAVPRPELLGRASARFAWPFLGYRLIDGEPATEAALSDSERVALAPALGRFLRELHQIPVKDATAAGAGPDLFDKFSFSRRRPELVENLQRAGFGAQAGVIADETLSCSLTPGPMALCHGDLYSRHLLVDSRRQLTAVIDWGDGHVGDAAVDLSVAHAFLPPLAHEAFRESYGPISETTWQRARSRAIFHSAAEVAYTIALQDSSLEAEGRRSFSYLGLNYAR